MPSKTRTLVFKCLVSVPPGEAYRAFTNATLLRDWFCDAAQSDPRPGGHLYLWWNAGHHVCGEYLALEPDRKLTFTWHSISAPGPTHVAVSFAGQKDGTLVSVRHAGIGTGPKWARAAEAIATGWPEGLDNLRSVLETGADLRIMRRPLFGIYAADVVTPALAEARGLPATAGVLLGGTVEGLGAHAAGLAKDDIVVGLGGRRVADWPSFTNALAAHRAGDKVRVIYWRGAEKKTATVELSRRPAPNPPGTVEALLVAVRKTYAELNAALEEFLSGVTEFEADQRPAPGEWTVKELLAHFVACERDYQGWVAELILGGNLRGEAEDSLEFRPNVTPRLAALVASHPTVPELMNELKRAEEESLSLLAGLPAEFVARKPFYFRAADWAVEAVLGHLGEHREQFRATIASARG